jgi:alpha/beta superfamily hydrolase
MPRLRVRRPSTLAAGLLQGAIALLALHVVDDELLQPPAGTTAGDHVVAALVPLAVLALAAWAAPRARPGGRGAIALLLVLPAALSGVEALYYGGKGGLSGDDYTGLLAFGAAPVLLGLGAHALWTSRRRDDPPARRYARRTLTTVGAVVATGVLAMPFALAYVASHVARAEVPAPRLGAAHENVTLHTRDGLKLDGWYVPSRNRAAVIVFPGRSGTQRQARMLARHGYGVLLYDRRGEGRSEGMPNGWGWDFDEDIRAGIAFLQHRPDVDAQRIGGLGLSVGAEMLLQTAAETTDLAAVVSEGAGARTMGEEVDDVSGALDKASAALSYGMRDLTNAVLQDRRPPANLKTLVGRIAPRPVFFIHAGADEVGHRTPVYYEAAGRPKQIWEAPGGHTEGIEHAPREYERRVTAFLDGALLR